jgi:FkbM family methyltransferase
VPDGSLRFRRQQILGIVRNRGTRLLTRIPHERMRELDRRIRSSPAAQAALAPAASWYHRGPIVVSGGIGLGLRVATTELPLHHAHAGSIVRGTLEVPVQEALRRHLSPGDVFYDVGANLGFFSLCAALLVGSEGAVHAFEPVPWCARAVRVNAEANDFGQIVVHEQAASSETGRGVLQVVEEASWSHLSSTGDHPETRERIEVELVALDDLVGAGELPPPQLVKIDTEGAELQVIEGMRRTIAEHAPVLVVETHDTNERLVALLEELGYRVENIDGPEPVSEARSGIHALAVPRGD